MRTANSIEYEKLILIPPLAVALMLLTIGGNASGQTVLKNEYFDQSNDVMTRSMDKYFPDIDNSIGDRYEIDITSINAETSQNTLQVSINFKSLPINSASYNLFIIDEGHIENGNHLDTDYYPEYDYWYRPQSKSILAWFSSNDPIANYSIVTFSNNSVIFSIDIINYPQLQTNNSICLYATSYERYESSSEKWTAFDSAGEGSAIIDIENNATAFLISFWQLCLIIFVVIGIIVIFIILVFNSQKRRHEK